MLDFFKIEFNENTKYEELNIDFNAKEIYIDKSTIGKDEKEKLNYNFLAVGRANKVAKKLISDLANNSYFLTAHANGISVFTKFIDGESFLPYFKNKGVKVYNQVFYTLDKPIEYDINNRLIVIFSPVSDLPFNASIDRRMFFKDFPNIKENTPKNTYVLRIADIGGVLGSAYLNTISDNKIEERVQELINKIQQDLLISELDTVFYGFGKGATGALYHGIKMHSKTLAIDPLVSDEYYLKEFNDMHFTQGIFDKSKKDKFLQLFNEFKGRDLRNVTIITSINSEQFKYISEIMNLLEPEVNLITLNNKNITESKDIINEGNNIILSLINSLLYGFNFNVNLNTNY
ncbi:hypothetical protein APJL_1609 [Actinobacillus pleuropneumoniae serovar 3 str. JL03]|uniref:XcbB/CpsF family capsular polysaccharide biosynthesis protein n=1 Tax=Actinobacillus pleuropneumoniae serotype 3 (strain JL03) TaxID=434271 RepID=B0BRQ2_ACTPJ|nr:XcbB/CpsF family capsular polysaccharide biosynthesis protein [Actinobacillus pleuropneumoniae]ABY70161.1 hypothetical protein APJL_1609 [Actinobacillus pleuropneumoniae serovar 3 str. JL03]UKH15084.1 hypothetical protein D1112_08180 [Actinobacillus pleuropneumoniae]UKH44263.1 hypothetical protein D1096_08110 [Actinobacillus pleuropneumoniae]